MLTISLALAFILLAVIGGRLFFVFKSYQKEKRELENARTRLDQLYNSRVFPSAVNITREKEKLADLIDEYNELDSLLYAGQVAPEKMEAADFMPFLENTLRRIRDGLMIGRVVFPDKYTFGFEKYASGHPPAPKNIPRLVQQLKITESICQILPEAAVNELSVFAREEFEGASAASLEQASQGRRARTQPAGGSEGGGKLGQLYSAQHFKMTLRAREGSVLDLLNRLARLPMITVVTSVEITNPRQETTMGAAPAAQPASADRTKSAAGNQADETSRDKRIVLGREEVEVKLELDVYNFEPPMNFREGQASKTAGK